VEAGRGEAEVAQEVVAEAHHGGKSPLKLLKPRE
jgi:hypothetical protein